PNGTLGFYEAYIDTTSFGDGTFSIVITADADKYQPALTSVLLVVLPLPSEIEPIDPATPIVELNRGSNLTLEVRLVDTYNNATINETYILRVFARFGDDPAQYDLYYNSTTGHWHGIVPGTASRDKNTGLYTIRVAALMDNYNLASYQFKIDLILTRTQISIVGVEELEAFYSQNVTFTVHFTIPDYSTDMTDAVLNWTHPETSEVRYFTHIGSGIYALTVNTSEVGLGYGVWLLTFRGYPNDPLYAQSSVQFSLLVARLPTDAITPDPLTVIWGWEGSLSFNFWNTEFDRGVAGAKATYSYGPLENLNATDLGNGTYTVFIDSTNLESGVTYTLRVEFVLANYETAEGAISVVIQERDTEVLIISPEENQIDENPMNLRVPMGDTIEIILFYNDTDPIGGLGGGLAGANISDVTVFAGPSFGGQRPLVVEDLGDGYYRFIFDTSDVLLYFYSNGTPIVYTTPYFFTVGIDYPYRIAWEGTIRIQVVNIPTELLPDGDTSFYMTNGEEIRFEVLFNDTWHGVGIEDAVITTDFGVAVIVYENGSVSGGRYFILLRAVNPSGVSVIDIHLAKRYHFNQTIQLIVEAQPNEFDQLMTQVTYYGLPVAVVVIILLGAYVRVWSVPKRIRQINGQVKALSKGRIPKPITDVRTRQQLVAGLFNDTFTALAIKRVASQMPKESIEVAVPE
ncbi:MAG: hypothetical protein ACFE7R_09490, partial [Candidatus Hodarchaeota archaeon]